MENRKNSSIRERDENWKYFRDDDSALSLKKMMGLSIELNSMDDVSTVVGDEARQFPLIPFVSSNQAELGV